MTSLLTSNAGAGPVSAVTNAVPSSRIYSRSFPLFGNVPASGGLQITWYFPVMLLLCLGLAVQSNAQTIFIGSDQYAFQYQPVSTPTSIGLFFSASQTRYEFRNGAGVPVFSIDPVNDFTIVRGMLGVGSDETPSAILDVFGPAVIDHTGIGPAFRVLGESRLGTESVYTQVNRFGNLRFVGGAVMEIAGNNYAFKAESSSNGLFFNETEDRYEFRNSSGEPTFYIGTNTGNDGGITVSGQSDFQDLVGIGTSTPETDLQVIGISRFGDTTSYLEILSSGNFQLLGSANYLVGDDRYAFKAVSSGAGLLFNTTVDEFQLTDPDSVAVFSVNASGPDAGNTSISGDLTLSGTFVTASEEGLAQVAATATTASQLAAIRGGGINANTIGYLGVEGDSLHDGTQLDIPNDEIGVLGIAVDTVTGINDDFGVYGYSTYAGVRGENINGFYTELGTPSHALRVVGPTSFSDKISVDSFEVLTSLVLEEITEITSVDNGPFVLGFPGGNRLTMDRNSIQARSSSSESLLKLNPFGGTVDIGNGGGNVNLASTGTGVVTIGGGGGNVNIGNGGGVVNVATTAAGAVNIATGGGNVNLSDILFTDNADSRVGVGVADPAYTLTVRHPTGTLTRNGIALINNLTNTTWHLYSFTDGDLGLFEADSLKGRFDNVSGMYMVTSDRKLKIKIRDMGSVLDQVMDLQPRRYRYRSEEGGKRDYYGFVAQEVEEVFPDLVTMDPETGIRAVSYTELVPVALAAIQEQSRDVQEIEESSAANAESLTELTDRLEEALERINDLEQSLSACCTVQTDRAETSQPAAEGARLIEVVPNPSAGEALLHYYLPELSSPKAEIRITDSRGRQVSVLTGLESGFASVQVSSDNGPGQYLCSLYLEGQLVDALRLIRSGN